MQPEQRENLSFGLPIISGISKPGKFMNIYFAALLLSVSMSCSTNNSAKTTSFQNENAAVRNQNSYAPDKNVPVKAENSKTAVVKNGNSKPLECNDPNGYSLVVAKNPNRDHQGDFIPEDVNVVTDGEAVAKIELPTGSDVKNFSLNSVEKTKEGFELKAEWGGGLYHYELQYDFRCNKGSFYLYKVKTESFSTKNPDSGNYWDKKETKEIQIEPNLPIEKFSILDYLGNK